VKYCFLPAASRPSINTHLSRFSNHFLNALLKIGSILSEVAEKQIDLSSE
jgi:hypothetical protein